MITTASPVLVSRSDEPCTSSRVRAHSARDHRVGRAAGLAMRGGLGADERRRRDAGAAIVTAIALVVPLAPLVARVALQPVADASVLVLLIISLALHFLLSGLGLLFFGPEGFRTAPLAERRARASRRLLDQRPGDADDRRRAGAERTVVSRVRAHGRRQGAARDRGEPRRRAAGRHPTGAHGDAGLRICVAARRA